MYFPIVTLNFHPQRLRSAARSTTLQLQCVILRAASLCTCEHFSVARPGCQSLCADYDPTMRPFLAGSYLPIISSGQAAEMRQRILS